MIRERAHRGNIGGVTVIHPSPRRNEKGTDETEDREDVNDST